MFERHATPDAGTSSLPVANDSLPVANDSLPVANDSLPVANDSLPVANGETGSEPARCCGMMRCCGGARWFVGIALAAALVGLLAAMFLLGRASGISGNAGEVSSSDPFSLATIDATAAVSSDQFSMATGLVTGEAEGLFVLDHNSGLLQCSVIYPRIGQFAASFTANVADALATRGKVGKYMMVTGIADFRQASNNPIGSSVVYVLDSATGNYACYAIPFNRALMNANQPQSGALRLIAVGSASPIIDRDRR